jgi:hypothetical protein
VFRRVLRNLSFAALLVAAVLLGGAASAMAATPIVTNGDFETGTLEGWTSIAQPEGPTGWLVYRRAEVEMGLGGSPPPSGEWAAATATETPRTSYLYQDVTLPPATTDRLSMYLYYHSTAPLAVPSPNTLFASESPAAQDNQQVRVDVLKPNAPIESLSPNDILATVYASESGDPQEMLPTVVSADLSALAGQTVRLRIASVVQEGFMEVDVDDVAIASAPLPPAPEPVAAPLPSSSFTVGKLALDRKYGSAKLDVTLPGPGMLTVTDARRQVAIASDRSGPKEKPILIRTAAVQTGGPQTVRVFLRPTPAAKKLLGGNGKLPFRLQLTYTPDGGQTATQGYRGTLVKTLRRARR